MKGQISYQTLLLFVVVAFAQGKLEVSNLAQFDIAQQDSDLTDIPYSIANFGFAPFGKTMVSVLQMAPGMDKQCYTDPSKEYEKEIEDSFLLIPRGECPFVTKALHAQQLGAKMAIISDDEQHSRQIIMKDNGYGYKVTIPAIFINYRIGQKLLQLQNSTTRNIILKIRFENIKTEKANVILYLQAMNRLSYYFIQQFEPYYNKIKDYVKLSLVYDVMKCPACKPEDCYYNGEYCSVHYEHDLESVKGRMMLDQQLREQVIFDKYFDKWWAYMKCINLECSKLSELQACSNKCLKSKGVNINPEVFKKQVEATFDPSKDNSILRKQSEILKSSSVEVYPSVTINSFKLKGSLNAEFVFDDICNTLLKPPAVCSKYITESNSYLKKQATYWFTVVFVIIFGALIFGGLFVVCRRRMKRKLTSEMQGKVDDMVSKYIELYSERNKK